MPHSMPSLFIALVLLTPLCARAHNASDDFSKPDYCESRAKLVAETSGFFWRLQRLTSKAQVSFGWDESFEAFNNILENPDLAKDSILSFEIDANIPEMLKHFDDWAPQLSAPLLSRTLFNLAQVSVDRHKHLGNTESKWVSKRGAVFMNIMETTLKYLSPDDRAFRRMTYFIGKTRKALAFTPDLEIMPPTWRAAMERHWLRPDWKEAPQLPNLFWIKDHAPGDGLEVAGHCSNMSRTHHNGILGTGFLRKLSSPVMIGPYLIGALKWDGDCSLLALNNFRDSNGRLVIVAGMTYMMTAKYIPHRPRDGEKAPLINLALDSKFQVHPLLSVFQKDASGAQPGTPWIRYLELLKDAASKL